MCGIAGWVNYEENLTSRVKVMENMTSKLDRRGPDSFGFYISENVLLGHRRLVIVDPEGGAQPMTREVGDNRYTIVYNGELYNTEEVRRTLIERGHSFRGYSDTEVLLGAYMEWGPDCLAHINGIYAFGIWEEKERCLFLARDPLGVKPLFYSYENNDLVFASEIKSLLEHPMVEPIIDGEGIMEIFGLGPARSLGSGVFKDIKEVPPAHFITYNKGHLQIREYWRLQAKPHGEDFNTTIDHTRSLLIDGVERQLVSDVPVCTFLSGGLDSSAISAITANYLKRENKGPLDTFAIDYEDNDKYFKANEYQPNSDGVWAKKMARVIGSNHHNIILNNKTLVTSLKEAVKANDLPGMADIDSSLYLFCKEVRKKATVALSGECADEIFGGYPWYRRDEDIYANTFPWSRAIVERKGILRGEWKGLPLEAYVAQKYEDSLKQVPKLDGESALEARMREMFYLNIKWFMVTLLNRKDRMSMANSLEVRVPFADYRIVEYAFNIPYNMKFCDGREKGILRRSLEGILPADIIERKKSPYPKTHHLEYTKAVQQWMTEILQDPASPILKIIDREKITQIVETAGKSFKKPWFGQLMTGPQMIAYLIQINTWMMEYKVEIQE